MNRRVAWILMLALVLSLTPMFAGGGGAGQVAAADEGVEQGQVVEQATPDLTASEQTDALTADNSDGGESDTNATADTGPNGTTNADGADADEPEHGDNPIVDAATPEISASEGDTTGSGDQSPQGAAAAASPAASPVAKLDVARLSDIQVTLYCSRDPELTRIDNLGTAPITILSIGSSYAVASGEPYDAGSIVIPGGGTRIFRSGAGAVSGTILTTEYLYTDSAYDQDGAVIETDAGQITKPCDPAPKANLTDIKVTVSCSANPEMTRIDNLGAVPIFINSIGTLYDKTAAEPYVVNRTLGAGRTVIYRSGSGAVSGTVLTPNFIYTDNAYEKDGAVIDTNAGQITVRCEKKKVFPTQLSLSMSCAASPETTTITNVGEGPATLSKLWTTWDKNSNEPYGLNKTLQPGQSITYQSGPGAWSNVLTSQQIYTEYAGTAERLYVQVSTGKQFATNCPPGPKWIEVNLSTQYLIAWEGYTRVNETYVSTGRPGFDTPTGTWYVNTKLVSQTMAGCIQGECYYVPDVPWVMYFTDWGHAIHGTYWHNNFGHVMSHGCVNLPVSFAQWLYYWTPMGTPVVVHY